MNDRGCWISFDTMEQFAVDVFKGVGVPEKDAQVCANVLITADKRGIDSHGVCRLKSMYYNRIRAGVQSPVTHLKIIREGMTTAVIDGNNGMGPVIGQKAMSMAIEKAQQFGLGMVTVRNSTHFGIAGYYVMMAVEAGMIGITGTNSRPSVAPTFGVENMLGTNPLAFGMPTDEEFPFVLDCATSVTQRGKIEEYERNGKSLPEGWVVGENGKSETNARQVLCELDKGKAALMPFGGSGENFGAYKAYGYATTVEILSAALQTGSFLKQLMGVDANGTMKPSRLGHFFLVINVSAFTELDTFKKTAGDILRALRASKKAPNCDRIYTAGEKEHLAWLERKNKGIFIKKSLLADIRQITVELHLKTDPLMSLCLV